ncbi:hypothetical protein DID88_008384 [Monilinia fructigena]|uniref:Serine-rich protein n=1 Tax=Monilinia fructigena TaxID=38457 RepID=A0A395J549_9HELO|nr:hypothetical protein DID88_008384 [Monilinia fructigena]
METQYASDLEEFSTGCQTLFQRRPLHTRSDSETNRIAAVRLVPPESPQLLEQLENDEGEQASSNHENDFSKNYDDDQIYSRTPLPTQPAHILSPGNVTGKATAKPTSTTTHDTPQITTPATRSSTRPRPQSRKRLVVKVGDGKTFSLVPQDEPQPVEDSRLLSLSTKTSSSSKHQTDKRPTNRSFRRKPSFLSTTSTATEATNYKIYRHLPESICYESVFTVTPTEPNFEILDQSTPSTTIHHPREESIEESTGSVVHHSREDSIQESTGSVIRHTREDSIQDSTGSVIHRPRTSQTFQTSSASTSENSNYQVLEESISGSVIYRPQHRPQLSTSTSGDYSNPNIDLNYPRAQLEIILIYELYRGRTRDRSESLADSFLEGSFSSGSNYRVHQQSDKESTGSSVIHSLELEQQLTSSSEQENYVFREDLSRSISLSSGQGPAPEQSQESLHIPTLRTKKRSQKGLSSWAELPSPTSPHMNETPHQWSSQLSTVLSVSEGTGTERGSQAWSDSMGRRSSAFPSLPSRGSRNMLSISSSHGIEDALARSTSDSMDPPRPAWTRAGRGLSSSSISRYRNRLSGMFNAAPSDTSPRSQLWARLYYGSGERRYLPYRPESSSAGTPSRNGSFSMRSGSPNTENFPDELYSLSSPTQRRTSPYVRGFSQQSIEITPVASAAQGVGRLRTWSLISSVWSPHLRMDRRAARQSVWEPPQINFSTEGGVFGRRNIQVVMFIYWVPSPIRMDDRRISPITQNPLPRNARKKERKYREAARYRKSWYESARWWWRNLNRWMSAVGLLIIAAIIILAIEGTRKGW